MTWTDDAACKGEDPRHWFAIPIGSVYLTASRAGRPDDPYAYARSICAGCPVKAECLADAIAAQRQGRATQGMWGGLDEVERRALLRSTKRRKDPNHGADSGHRQHLRLGEKPCGPCTEAHRAARGYAGSKVTA